MEDPVVASDGHTYNRQGIQNWFDTQNISPITRDSFEDNGLRPNIAIRKQVIRWRELHGLHIPSFAATAKAQAGGGVSDPNIKYLVRFHQAAAASFLHQL